MAAVKEEKVEIPQLNKEERLSLQNIMLRMALEQERISNLGFQIKTCRKELEAQESLLKLWQVEFNKKLKSCNLSIDQLDIDAETGEVTVSNIQNLPRGK